jgi:hypothetical protein
MPTKFSVSQAAVENGTFIVTVSFTDEDGNSVVPNSLMWSLVAADRVTVINSRSDVVINPPAASVDIVLTGPDLVKDAGKLVSWRFLVIEGTYDGALGSNLPIVDHLHFPIVGIAKVPN